MDDESDINEVAISIKKIIQECEDKLSAQTMVEILISFGTVYALKSAPNDKEAIILVLGCVNEIIERHSKEDNVEETKN